jgi:hypothetical protein
MAAPLVKTATPESSNAAPGTPSSTATPRDANGRSRLAPSTRLGGSRPRASERFLLSNHGDQHTGLTLSHDPITA